MPRKVQRFSRLMDKLRSTGGSFGEGDGEVQNFYRFLTGQRKITVDNAISGQARKLVSVAVMPFGSDIQATPGDSDRFQVTMSTYSYAGWDSRVKSQLSAAELGWAAPAAANKNAKEEQFFPALAKLTMTRSGAVTLENKVSGVTGKTYTYTPRRTFSLPFGRTLASVTEPAKGSAAATDIEQVEYEGVKASIYNQVTDPLLNGLVRIGFEPEVNRGSQVTAEAFGGTVTTTGVVVG